MRNRSGCNRYCRQGTTPCTCEMCGMQCHESNSASNYVYAYEFWREGCCYCCCCCSGRALNREHLTLLGRFPPGFTHSQQHAQHLAGKTTHATAFYTQATGTAQLYISFLRELSYRLTLSRYIVIPGIIHFRAARFTTPQLITGISWFQRQTVIHSYFAILSKAINSLPSP